jgi:FKBP-type peptidyl-prolyl cis-trans isomerase FkpA
MRKKTGIVFNIFLLIVIVTGVTGCFKNTNSEQEELEIIQNFLDVNDIDTEPTASGLYYVELIAGTGEQPMTGDTVEVYYEGFFLTGSVFVTNMEADPHRIAIGSYSVIAGMEEGITYMREGGRAMLIMPSSLAYGSVGNYYLGIPGYTPLGFDIILDKVIYGPYH